MATSLATSGATVDPHRRVMQRATSLFRALEADWLVVGFGDRAAGRLARWAADDPTLEGFGSPAQLVARCHSRIDPGWSNRALQALLRVGAADPLAARTVLQALIPALAGLARRAKTAAALCNSEGEHWDQEVVAIAWEQIVSLSADPPPWPAMAIVNLTWSRLRTVIDRQRRQMGRDVPLDDHPIEHTVEARSAAERLVLILGEAVRRGAMDRDSAAVILCTRVLGFSPAEAARAAGRTPASIYKQRERAERSLVVFGDSLSAAS